MNKKKKMAVNAVDSQSQKAAGLDNSVSTLTQSSCQLGTESLIKKLNLVEIDIDDFDFDDVHENVKKLLLHYFGDGFNEIELLVDELSDKSGLGYDDYDKFIRLANKGKFKVWSNYCDKILSGKPDVAHAVLDLYFQKTMIQSYDIHCDLLIYAYVDDIQPFIN